MHTPRGADERGPWAYAPLPAQGAQDIPRRVPSSPALLSSGFLAASAPQRQHVSPSGGGGWPLGDHAPQSLQRQRSLGGLGTVQSGRSRASQLRGSPRASATEASPERAMRYGTVLLPDTAGPPEDAHDVEKASDPGGRDPRVSHACARLAAATALPAQLTRSWRAGGCCSSAGGERAAAAVRARDGFSLQPASAAHRDGHAPRAGSLRRVAA
jgi:hypothetical protein